MSAPSHDPFTLTKWILTEQQKYKNSKGDLSILLNCIQLACKIISSAAKATGIHSLYGYSGGTNASGDEVKKLDVFANDCMINCISFSHKVLLMASEEMENPIHVTNCEEPKYAVVFDPLDGSSNIDANVSVGTIFGIYRVRDKNNANVDDLLQKGSSLVCAGYAMYGDATLLVISFGDNVQGFTLDPQIGEFILTHRDIKIPEKGSIYSINEGNARDFDEVVTNYLQKCKEPDHGKPKKARYIGSMVADVHRTLLYGGIFMYPATNQDVHGKLRLLYELNPMSFIVETAGGRASTGTQRILDLEPTSIHGRAPVFIGSKCDVDEVDAMYKEYYSKKDEKNKTHKE